MIQPCSRRSASHDPAATESAATEASGLELNFGAAAGTAAPVAAFADLSKAKPYRRRRAEHQSRQLRAKHVSSFLSIF